VSTKIADRFRILNTQREQKLERARYSASLTIPSTMPPLSWNQQQELPQPFSSIAARGTTSMASRMLSALLPLNDMPFFRFEMSSGDIPDPEIDTYLNNLSYQVYSKLSQGNLRETVYQLLQSLIIVGDVMVFMDDDMQFRVIRLDRYVAKRDAAGRLEELIYLEYESAGVQEDNSDLLFSTTTDQEYKNGYTTLYNRVRKDGDIWKHTQQDSEGVTKDSGEWTVPPFAVLRWSTIPGEAYGRSHVEDIIGDVKTLEAFTEGLIQGVVASSAFWLGIDPTGITEIDDIAHSPAGSIVSARINDVHTISPASTMSPQLGATQTGAEAMRREVGRAFLLDSASMPTGDRVTATAVRMIGQELEHVLGGAFSAIAREMMTPIVRRTLFLMVSDGLVDPRLREMFDQEQGMLDIKIVTGLQALSRDSDLTKLMQMGEMVRNLPEPAAAMFKWDAYGKALISSLGFNPESWVKSEEELQAEQLERQQAEAQMQAQSQGQQMGQQIVGNTVAQAAQQDLAETGGQGIQQVLQQLGGQ
jgi:hypothetical protein